MKLNEWNIYLHAALLTTIQLAVAFFLYAGVYTFFDHQTLLFVGTVCTAYLVGALLYSFNYDKIRAKERLAIVRKNTAALEEGVDLVRELVINQNKEMQEIIRGEDK